MSSANQNYSTYAARNKKCREFQFSGESTKSGLILLQNMLQTKYVIRIKGV